MTNLVKKRKKRKFLFIKFLFFIYVPEKMLSFFVNLHVLFGSFQISFDFNVQQEAFHFDQIRLLMFHGNFLHFICDGHG